MTKVKEKFLEKKIFELIKKAETSLPRDVEKKLKEAYQKENNPLAKIQLREILKNIKFARKNSLPICQDTGLISFYVNLNANENFTLNIIPKIEIAIKNALKVATEKIPLRKNVVDSITREPRNSNLGNKIPEIHFNFLPKNSKNTNLEIIAMPKGAGSENLSSFSILNPNETTDGIKKFILKKVADARGRPCPPIILGIGIGGSSERAMELSKLALIRELGKRNKKREIAKLEEEILKEVNKLDIGVMGLGGKTTCLGVNIETADTHTASLPVAISFSCWAMRRAKIKISL